MPNKHTIVCGRHRQGAKSSSAKDRARCGPASVARTGLLAAGAVVVLSSCAPMSMGTNVGAEARRARQCFWNSSVDNYRTQAGHTLYVRAGRGSVFRIETFGSCFNLDSSLAIGIQGGVGTVDRLCEGDRVRLLLPSSFNGPERCEGVIDRALSEHELGALPSRYRP